MKKKFLNLLSENHKGYAIQFEVIATLFMMTVFSVMTLYTLRVMNVQRYMNTVLTSTAATASRWGGVNSNAYKSNVSNVPLLKTAQKQLDIVAEGYGAKIYGSPDKISYDSQEITLTIEYHLPGVFETSGKVTSTSGSYDMFEGLKNLKMTVKVNSIMNAGKLL